MRNDPFINPIETTYIASETQQKKIIYLEQELKSSEKYISELEKNIELNNDTIHKLIQARSNHEILSKYYESTYKLQKKLKQAYEEVKLLNGKWLIQMQLRIEERSSYYEKLNEFQNTIKLLRKGMEDKEQSFSFVVDRLRKYENIRELILQNKIGKDIEKCSKIKMEDKDEIIKKLSQKCDQYKKMSEVHKPDIDIKLQILRFALASNQSYQKLKHSYFGKLNETMQKKLSNSSQFLKQSENELKQSNPEKKLTAPIDKVHRELVKQLKKQILSHNLMQNALNEAIEKNEELITENRTLTEANTFLKDKLENLQIQISNLEGQIKRQNLTPKICEIKEESTYPAKIHAELKNKKQKQLYIQRLKSENYQVNVRKIMNDVEKMGEFMVMYVAERGPTFIKSFSCGDLTQVENTEMYEEDELEDLSLQQI